MNKMKNHLPCVVSIAGTDPSGGAGIQADIKSISATGSYAASIITALVAQNTQGIQEIYSISPEFVTSQINAVFIDLKINAVKIGMLFNADIIAIVASALEKFKPKYVVLDPVMVAKDGSYLLDFAALNFLKQRLFPLATVITPNLLEAEKMIGHPIISLISMEQTAKELGNELKSNVLLKGGHFTGDNSSDVLFSIRDQSLTWFHSKRIHTQNTHGTGCTLSSAMASYLAQHYSLIEAVHLAKHYLTNAIQQASTMKIGHGCGPVDHFYFLRNMSSLK